MKHTIIKAATLLVSMFFGIISIVGQNTVNTGVSASDSATSVSTSDYLATPDPTTGASVVVNHSAAIERLIQKKENENLREVKGFRIQIFSGNRGTASRNRAFEIKDLLLQKEPTLDVYVTYTSPFWKVRVGNCASHEKAQELRTWMIEQFPDFATETYIVPSTVLVP